MQCTGRVLLKQRNDHANKSLLWTCFNNSSKLALAHSAFTRLCQTWSECQHKDSTMACLLQKNVVFKERLKWPYALCNHQADSPLYVWRLAWCLIWWFATFEKVCSYMFIQNTEWTIWYHRTTKTQPILILMIVLYTFSEEAQLNGSTGKQESA